jgi:hypothetical protein
MQREVRVNVQSSCDRAVALEERRAQDRGAAAAFSSASTGGTSAHAARP